MTACSQFSAAFGRRETLTRIACTSLLLPPVSDSSISESLLLMLRHAALIACVSHFPLPSHSVFLCNDMRVSICASQVYKLDKNLKPVKVEGAYAPLSGRYACDPVSFDKATACLCNRAQNFLRTRSRATIGSCGSAFLCFDVQVRIDSRMSYCAFLSARGTSIVLI